METVYVPGVLNNAVIDGVPPVLIFPNAPLVKVNPDACELEFKIDHAKE